VSVFFLVAMGQQREILAWKRIAASHAAVLDLAVDVVQWDLASGAELLVCTLDHPARNGATARGSDRRLHAGREAGDPVELHANDARPATTTSLRLDPRTESVRVRVPLASPDQAYVSRSPAEWVVTNDLRLAAARQALELDPHGVYALLQYGAIPAPFTLFRGIARLQPGHEATVDSTSSRLRMSEPSPGATLDGDPEAHLLVCIDRVLLGTRKPTAIFFSGGVDSALLAARVRAAGVQDVPLLNYAFGSKDVESAHAQQVAARLGMPFERIEHSPEKIVGVLASAARDYSYPFGDYSSLPTNLLVRATTAWLPPGSEVVDGTGADGAFAVGFTAESEIRSRLEPVSLLPSSIGQLAGYVHAWTGMTASDGPVARIARLVKRATTMPPLLASVVAQSSLHDEFFHVPRGVRNNVDEALMQMVATLAPNGSLADRATMLDVVHVCGGIFAAKNFDPLRHRGVDVVYPFLHPDVLGPSLGLPWGTRCAGAETKALLKRALARHVPSDLVYRKKSGFTPPLVPSFTKGLRDFVESRALRRDGSLAEYLNWSRVERLFARVFSGERVHSGALHLLWTLTFTGSWLDGLSQLRAPAQEKVGADE
jgi:asparagine synthase (glutamine-hydrolysing)